MYYSRDTQSSLLHMHKCKEFISQLWDKNAQLSIDDIDVNFLVSFHINLSFDNEIESNKFLVK